MSYYEILGVAPDASATAIKKAYRRLASANHPDRVGGDGHERMAEVNRAYEVLSDPARRAQYDRTGADTAVNIAALAETRLLGMFNTYLEDETELTGDLVQKMKNGVTNAMAQLRAKQGELRRKNLQYERRAKRVKGPALMQQLAKNKIAETTKKIAQHDDELAIAEVVMKMLEAYADAEPLSETPRMVWTTLTN